MFKPSAERALARLPQLIQARILKKIESLAANPRQHGVEKLAGGQDEYRVRVGDCRIIFAIDDTDLVVIVLVIGNRRDVYRGR